MVFQRGGRGAYIAKVRVDGAWVQVGLGTREERVASRMEQHIVALSEARSLGVRPEPAQADWAGRQAEPLRRRLRELGLLGPEQQRVDPRIQFHLEHFLEVSAGRAKNPKDRRRRLRERIERVVASCKWVVIDDMTADGLQQYAERRRKVARDGSINHDIAAIKQFVGWLHRRGKLRVDTMFEVKPLRDRTRRSPMVLSVPEQRALVEGTRQLGSRAGLSGERRALLYWTALTTGARAGELVSMDPGLHFDGAACTINLSGEETKSGKPCSFRLPAELAEALGAAGAGQWWPVRRQDLSALLRDDAAAIGIPTKRQGRELRFHSLRHSFCTTLAQLGVPIATAQRLMRHADPRHTMNIYTHIGEADIDKALRELPALSGASRIGSQDTDTHGGNAT